MTFNDLLVGPLLMSLHVSKYNPITIHKPGQDGLMVTVSTSYVVGCGFMSRPGHTKDHHQNGTNYPPLGTQC